MLNVPDCCTIRKPSLASETAAITRAADELRRYTYPPFSEIYIR